MLGLVYLLAFWSLGSQILGLVGHDGILPAEAYLNQIRTLAAAREIGLERFHSFPTLLWINASDALLTGLCSVGVALAALVAVGVAPLIIFPALWGMYLSLSVVCQDFLSYQWDVLLLESGFLGIFIAPFAARDRLRRAVDPPRLGLWLLWFLLFRLMFGSGAMKIGSDDPTWENLTALAYHYETQPLPTPLAWYAHHLPISFNKISTAAVFISELFAPLLIAGPRRLRMLGCALMVGLQLLIALTGNYAFFNLLAAALCVLLLDDAAFARLRALVPWRSVTVAVGEMPSRPVTTRWRHATLIVVAAITLPVAGVSFGRSIGLDVGGMPIVGDLARFMAPFRSANTYGLFSVMTTTRPEIIVEGSDDGVEWRAYEFKYKPGDLKRRPPWVAPHQPRLDWQLWFASLSRYENEPWFELFCTRLLEGSPDVLHLIERNPFGDRTPRYVRAILQRYDFASPAQRREMGVWWTARPIRDYSPVLSVPARGQ